ncbi:MAG TPA: PPOX class F420-dependent oxidoreductase [Polyangiales bacterium]|jgi:PPOX class probable F420-dependent enzyme
MRKLPEKLSALLKQQVFAHLATLMPDGSPQVSPVWVDVDGDTILVNSAEGRVKDTNMRKDARVALSVTAPDNAYSAFMVRGRVVAITTEGAEAHIDRMAKKYMGKDSYPYRTPTEKRVLYKIEVEKISSMG